MLGSAIIKKKGNESKECTRRPVTRTIAHTRFAGTVSVGCPSRVEEGHALQHKMKGEMHIHEPDDGPHLSEGGKKVTLYEG
ncbi:8822_t:CDS:1, partial [Paraglomus occultum]